MALTQVVVWPAKVLVKLGFTALKSLARILDALIAGLGKICGHHLTLGLTEIVDHIGFVLENYDIALAIISAYIARGTTKVNASLESTTSTKPTKSSWLEEYNSPCVRIIGRGRPARPRGTVYVPPTPKPVPKFRLVITTPDGIDQYIPDIVIHAPLLGLEDCPIIRITPPQLGPEDCLFIKITAAEPESLVIPTIIVTAATDEDNDEAFSEFYPVNDSTKYLDIPVIAKPAYLAPFDPKDVDIAVTHDSGVHLEIPSGPVMRASLPAFVPADIGADYKVIGPHDKSPTTIAAIKGVKRLKVPRVWAKPKRPLHSFKPEEIDLTCEFGPAFEPEIHQDPYAIRKAQGMAFLEVPGHEFTCKPASYPVYDPDYTVCGLTDYELDQLELELDAFEESFFAEYLVSNPDMDDRANDYDLGTMTKTSTAKKDISGVAQKPQGHVVDKVEIKSKSNKSAKSGQSTPSKEPTEPTSDRPLSIITGRPINGFLPSVHTFDSDSDSEHEEEPKVKGLGQSCKVKAWDSQKSLDMFRIEFVRDTGVDVGPHRLETKAEPMFGWEWKGYEAHKFGQPQSLLEMAWSAYIAAVGNYGPDNIHSLDAVCDYLGSLSDEESAEHWLRLRRMWHYNKWLHLQPVLEGDTPLLILVPATPELEPTTPESSHTSEDSVLLTPPKFTLGPSKLYDGTASEYEEEPPSGSNTTQTFETPVLATTPKGSVNWCDMDDDEDELMVFPDMARKASPTSALGLTGIEEDDEEVGLFDALTGTVMEIKVYAQQPEVGGAMFHPEDIDLDTSAWE